MEHHIHISSKDRRAELKLRELWRARDLVLLMVQKSFRLAYKQTVLGPVWILIQPLLPSAVYAVVFGEIASIGTDGVPRYLFYLIGSALWGLFSSSLSSNANVFASNAYVFGKVYFPRLAVPVSNMIVSVLKYCIQMVVVLAILGVYVIRGAVRPVWQCWPLLPLIVLELAILGMSVGMLASSVTTKYRDLGFMVSTGVRLWMYGSPVVYPLAQLTNPVLRTAVMINPVTAPMELFRYGLTGSGAVEPWLLLWSAGFTALCCLGSILLFNRVEKNFIDKV